MISNHRKQPFTKSEFKEIFSQVPRACVDLLIKTPEGFVMIERKADSWNDLWHFPGGMVLYREKIQDTITRVAKEELGITLKDRKLIGYMEFFSELEQRGFGFSVSWAFLCTTDDNIPAFNQAGEEIKVWNKIPDKIIKEHREFLLAKKLLTL